MQPSRSSSGGACAARHTLGPGGMQPWPPGTLPHQRQCTGGSRPWFPILRLAFQKWPSSCGNLVGAVGFEPTNPSLVRRVLYH
jgi:hypothetical protein